jgi:hypothetical protein
MLRQMEQPHSHERHELERLSRATATITAFMLSPLLLLSAFTFVLCVDLKPTLLARRQRKTVREVSNEALTLHRVRYETEILVREDD